MPIMKDRGGRKLSKGKIHIYTGRGKGKSTAAFGLAMRGYGHGFSVCIIQFLKAGGYTGEFMVSKKFPRIAFKQFGPNCPWSERMKKGIIDCGDCRYCFSVHKEDKVKSMKGVEEAKKASRTGKYDMLILDEIFPAINVGLVKEEDLLDLIENKHDNVELILTGAGASEKLMEHADYVTNMKPVKHPFNKGLGARRGIEY